MIIPVVDLKRQTESLSKELDDVLIRVRMSAQFLMGAELLQFENEFAEYVGVSDCVGVANGTEALELAMRAVGVRPGGRVALVANAGFYATSSALRIGAFPHFIEVDKSSMTMCPESLAKHADKHCQAIVVTHLYGRMANMPAILEIARSLKTCVIEDCAQAHGAELDGKKAGAWGDVGCFSFYPTKNLGALGDGGAVVGSRLDIMQSVRSRRQYGWIQKYHVANEGGCNSRMDELQAAVLRIKLKKLSEWNIRRRKIAKHYSELLSRFGVVTNYIEGASYVGHLFVLRNNRRHKLREQLAARGIGTEIHYPIPDHLQPAIRSKSFSKVHLPITEMLCDEVLTLPCYPEITEEEISHVKHVMEQLLHTSL
jgi:dTDP-4-amino-4,6-dideoxygalactose transaminase